MADYSLVYVDRYRQVYIGQIGIDRYEFLIQAKVVSDRLRQVQIDWIGRLRCSICLHMADFIGVYADRYRQAQIGQIGIDRYEMII